MTSMIFSNYLQPVAESTSVTVESRLKNKSNLKPYWNNLIANISKNLWLPKKLNSENMNINSWFSVKLWNDKNKKSLEKIINQSVIHSEECIIKQRSKKIRFYPTSEQKVILKQWFGTCRYFYNKTLHDLNYKDHDVCYESPMHQAYVEPKYPTTNYIDQARRIFANVPDWAKEVPYQSKRLAIKQCCDAVKNAKIKYKKLKQIQKVKFKSKKNTKESIYIPKSAVSALGVYHTKLGQLKFAEEIQNAKYDCRLLVENGQYFLVMPYDKVIPKLENQKLGIVALDCLHKCRTGVRTFQTFYNPELAGKFGANDFNRIYRLCYTMDNLISKTTKVNAKKRRNMKKALARIRIKIKNLVSELHHKSALFFAKHFDAVVIPPFETSDMVTKLVSKVARSMLGWSHYKFQQILKAKCEEFGTNFILQNEAYTSKTCSSCGHVHRDLGSKKVLKCEECGVEIDRDINGARGIYLRALGEYDACEDNPSLITN